MMIYGSVSTGSHIEKLVFEDELGWSCAFVSEIDKYASQVIRYHAPNVPNLGDFSRIKADERTTRVKLLCGGTPCQDFSVAGLRAGLAGERGNLTLEFLRLADRLKPTWILWENVPGILSLDEGRAFGAFLGGLAQLGYGFAYRVLDAQFFGVPQRRRRVFVVGHLGDWRRAAAVLFERESLSGHPAPSREAGKRVAGTLEARASTGGYDPGAHGAASGHLIPMQEISKRTGVSTDDPRVGIGIGGDGDPMYTLQSGAQHGVAYQCHGSNVGPMGAIRAGNGNELGGVPFVAFNGRQDPCPNDHQTGALDEDGSSQCIAFSSKVHGADAVETAPTLRSMNNRESNVNGGGQVAVAFTERTRAEGRNLETLDDQSYALTNPGSGGRTHSRQLMDTEMRVRRLMPVECERLQGWPDGWTEYGRTKKGELVEISDTQRYKIIGNGWALPCIRWIAQRIAWVDAA